MNEIRTSKKAEEVLKKTKLKRARIWEDWETARKELVEKLAILDAPYERRIHDLDKKVRELEDKSYELHKAEQKRKWTKKFPPLDIVGDAFTEKKMNPDFLKWCEYSDEMKEPKKHMYSINYVIGRQPKSDNPDLKIIAIGDVDEKLYLCFNIKKKKLVNWLCVKPSRHMGDETSVYSNIDEFNGRWNVREPLRNWLRKIGAKKGFEKEEDEDE